MRDGSNVRQELAAVHYVSVWCECVCVVLCCEGNLHLHVHAFSRLGYCAVTGCQTQPEEPKQSSRNFSFR